MTSTWTDDRVEKLKALWAQGLAASVIAARIGGFEHTSDGGRLAVLGKINRLGLSYRKRSRSQRGSTKKQRAQRRANPPLKPKPNRNTGIFGDTAPLAGRADVAREPAGPDIVIPEAERRSFQDLTPDCCRWPFGDPRHADFHFCGRKKAPGLPYCEFHAARAFQPVVLKPRLRESHHVYTGHITDRERAEAANALGSLARVE